MLSPRAVPGDCPQPSPARLITAGLRPGTANPALCTTGRVRSRGLTLNEMLPRADLAWTEVAVFCDVTGTDFGATTPGAGPAEQLKRGVDVPAYSALTHLECSRTGETYDADVVQGVSGAGVPLLARYDVELAGRTLTREALAHRPATLWRYHEMLPVRDPASITSLGEGMSPLLPLPRYGARIGVPKLLMKDEGLIPTGTFKARGAAVGVSRAAELGIKGVAMPTNGNAGAAWAAYAARAGMSCLIAMPVGAPAITRTECVATGAELYLVDGLIGDAGKLINAAVREREGYQEVSTLKEPYRLEGKKTMGYEIVEQLGWRVPDVILYPAGGGVGLIGIHKALLEMQRLGWIDDRLPRLVAVQAEGCAPIVRAFQAGADVSEPFPDARTVAFGITVPKALGDFLMLDAVRATEGTAIAVSDEALLAEQRRLAADEGTFICPEGAACMAAASRLRESGFLGADETVVVLNTGVGLIYPETVPVDVPALPVDGRIPAGGRRGRWTEQSTSAR
jgi:threonine synthase